ncbi:protein phosphatase 1 regulatory subunit 3A-like isoform X2 [Sinocyclocheilus grahami]|uniref:protein phosphatase 1 regulatory subunit 3A-like isoform X2 n=1 Tax=Sinocyclocheilus grahami TaxID=75366 RepID=UPI0007ACB139|nr:PREDICTED: protein phosphatase 1 regulatory subunit 3A-like isoform X2 [Sinocyclocheilus grahami]
MAQGNNGNFLTIPSQEELFKTARDERFENNSNDEDEEETEEDVRLIPRSSPVPRKRGSSIADETAEYMRIRLVLPNRRVSFADSTGAELVDVRMFVPFESDDEDDSRWVEEEARYRKAYREPTYCVWPEFQPLTGTELLLAVHSNKLEVESVASVPDEPLSFEVLIRVLNISFHKSVYARSTMDGWINYFDYPAEYVQGSNEGETDKFSVTLAFASPYLFNGARIDFVVRYETPDGEFWANNSGRNYSVSLLQSYEDDTVQATTADTTELRGILKPPRYRADNGFDDFNDKGDDLSSTKCEAAENQASFAQPVIVQPEIDIKTAKNSSSSPESTRTSSTAGCPQSTSALESMSSNNLPQTEESGLKPSTLSVPQSRSTQQISEPQDQFYNVGPSLSFPLPAVLVPRDS